MICHQMVCSMGIYWLLRCRRATDAPLVAGLAKVVGLEDGEQDGLVIHHPTLPYPAIYLFSGCLMCCNQHKAA